MPEPIHEPLNASHVGLHLVLAGLSTTSQGRWEGLTCALPRS